MNDRAQLIWLMAAGGVLLGTLVLLLLTTSSRADRETEQGIIASSVAQGAVELGHLSHDYVIYREPQQLARWWARYNLFRKDVAKLRGDTPEGNNLVRSILNGEENIKEVFESIAQGVPLAAELTTPEGLPFLQVSWSRMAIQSQGLSADATQLSEMRYAQAEENRVLANWLVAGMSVVTSALLFFTYLLLRSIAERRRIEKAQNRFISVLAHELRNPLAPLLSSIQILDLLTKDHPDALGKDARDALVMADRQVSIMGRLLDDLLDTARIAHGKFDLKKEPTDLVASVRHAALSLQSSGDLKELEFEVALPEEKVLVEADPVRLEQIVTNLLTNAVKFTPPQGKITLNAGIEGGEAVIRVKDTGIGIKEEMLGRIFQPFFQSDHAPSRPYGGLGIGLMLVETLCRLHGGKIVARSEGEGRGSEFIVTLPLLSLRTSSALLHIHEQRA